MKPVNETDLQKSIRELREEIEKYPNWKTPLNQILTSPSNGGEIYDPDD